ncbi:MAG TPA: TspO protein [Cyanobacteria bacterium UBA9971]|nr:TspO protein [Cyanobacteria bacterium UBA9971]
MSILKLSGSLLLCLSAGIIGKFAVSPESLIWYEYLFKPVLTPPIWIFMPVWTILYLLMGISLFMVLNTENSNRKTQALILFGVQLFLNALWSPVFFGLRSIIGGFFVIFLLWLSIFFTFYKFYKLSQNASYFLVPYLLWVSFSVGLSLSVWILN